MASESIIILMDLANNGDLSQLIEKQKEKKQFLPENDILSFFVQITSGLQYIHKKNILHRDLKPKNIFLTSQKLIKIGDFGISKSLNHTLDLATTAIGTPYYLSPEVYRRQPYNYKSDMWSLGMEFGEKFKIVFKNYYKAVLCTRCVHFRELSLQTAS